jgi:Reverse transcriptase (RNA-dependent DNA polymerase)
LAEIAFATISNRGRAMMYRANIPDKVKPKVCRDAFQTATKLDGLILITFDGATKTRYEHWCGQKPAFADHLRTWGEAGTVKVKKPPKTEYKGVTCMMLGYADNHAGDVYRMWDPDTDGVHEKTRDVTWLKRMYFTSQRPTAQELIVSVGAGENNSKQANVNAPTTLPTIEEVPEEEDQVIVEEKDDDDEPVQALEPAVVETAVATTRAGRATRAPVWMKDYTMALTDQEAAYLNLTKGFEMGLMGAGVGGGFINTQELHVLKYDQAMKGPDKKQWEEAVKEEHDRMIKNKVWKDVPKASVPKEATILTSTWAMKKKASGVYRARLNARGYEQIDGEHFDKDTKSSPVVSLMTIMIILILMVMAGWYGSLTDVHGAFLKGHFGPGEQLHMHVPQGFKKCYGGNVVLLFAEDHLWIGPISICVVAHCVGSICKYGLC